MSLKPNRLHGPPAGRRVTSRGLSIVELLVGVAVGLVIVSAAIGMFVGNIGTSRKMLVEARVNQDLRAAADIVARDLRRGGYWENSIAGTMTSATGTTAAATNPNATITASSADSSIEYSVARDTPAGRSTFNTQETDEGFGFRLSSGVLQMKIGSSGWQALTDPAIVTVNNFSITPTVTVLDVRDVCARTCVGSSCPTVSVRNYAVLLRGTAVADSNVTRVIREQVRVRNDALAGTCPN
jgi:type IV pilus assembly protein PilW